MLELRDVHKIYHRNASEVRAADGLNCTVAPGDFVVVHGPSGSGKSTLLMMLGGMLRPDAGAVSLHGESIYGWGHAKRNRYRRRQVGFVFQRFYLIPYLNVRDNIRLRLTLQGAARAADERIAELVRGLGLERRLDHRPGELSVGEQQRVAVARALAGAPELVLADEPTGNLDVENGEIIVARLREESRQGRAVVMVTHNPAWLDLGTRRLRLVDGKIHEE